MASLFLKAILFVFCCLICLELLLQQYFRDRWLLLDEIIILLSLGLVILDLSMSFGA